MPETRGRGLEEIQDGFRRPLATPARLGLRMLDGTRFRGSPRAEGSETISTVLGEVSRTETGSGHSITTSQRITTNTV